MRRSSRRLVAILTLLGLLVVQGAVAAYPCAVVFESAPLAMSDVNRAMVDCAGMPDTAETALCLQHCTQGDDANSTVGAADVPAPAMCRYVVVAPAALTDTASTLAAARPPARSTSPPPLLLSQRLRI
jgi:hypothetical protein